MGELVRSLIESEQSPGYHQVQWNGKDNRNQTVATGMYIYRFNAGEFAESRKMLLIK